MNCSHNIINVRKSCRICLTDNSKNISIENLFQCNAKDSPSILWALEKVMCMKVECDENYPSEICPNCLSFLNISYNLREQFKNSQRILKEHFTKCLEGMEGKDEFVVAEGCNLLTPKIEVDIDESTYSENNEKIEYIYEESIEKLEEYLNLKMDQESSDQSEGIPSPENIQTDYIEESNNELSDNELIQMNISDCERKKGLQIKQLDIDQYVIENHVEVNSGPSLIRDKEMKNLSSLDEELFQAAYNLRHKCPGCPKVYSSLRNLNRHKETCVKFKQAAASQSQPVNGKKEDVDSQLYEHNECFKFYSSSDELEQLKDSAHSRLNVLEAFRMEDLSELDQELFKGALLLKYECDTCPKVYSSADKLEKHKTTCEKPKGKYVICKADAKGTQIQPSGRKDKSVKLTEEICLDNLSQTERDMFQSALNLQHKCPYCRRLYSTVDRFKKHVMNCETKKTNLDVHKCEICGHISTSKNAKMYHKQTAHKEKRFACEKCGKLFALSCTLKQHMQSHEKDKTKVVCPICGKGFHYSGGLFYHMKMHKNEMNYLCEYCERRFINLNALKRHLATHTGERLYQCRVCEKKFKGSTEVRIHELRHTNNRPHRCDYCGKGYASKSNLQFHIITHKGNVPCNQCNRKFLDADVLQLHMKIKHKVQEDPFFSVESKQA